MTSSALPYGKVLNYEQFIDHQLRRTRARIKITDFITAGLLLLAVLIAVLFVEVVLDHLVGLPFWSRRIVLLACAAGSGTYAVLGIVYPLVRRVSGFYAAQMIEEADPSFKNSLITYLDLKRRRGALSRSAMAAIEARAAYHLTQIEVDNVVNQRRLLSVAYGFSAVVVVFCLYAVLSPRSVLDSARRALLADLVRPTRTRLLNITPGDDPESSRISAGTEALFTVEVQGARPSRVVLHASTDGGKSFASHEFSSGTRHHDPWRSTVPNVQQDIEYYVTGGDAQSRTYHLEVIPAPMVTGVWLDLDFPAYLNLPRRTGLEGGNVEAIEGTIVTVRARPNEPAQSARLTFTQVAPVSMDVSLSDRRELTGRFKVERTDSYTINYRTTAGHRNRDPVVYEIVALPDRPPWGVFEKPEHADVDVSVDEQVELVIKGGDDHGVRDVTLRVDRSGQTLLAKTLLGPQQPSPLHFRATERLDLGAWKLEPGEELTYWMTVRDTKEPVSNRFETRRRRIKVGGRLTPSQQGLGDRAGPQVKEQARVDIDRSDRPAAKPGDAPEVPQANAGPHAERNGLERLPKNDRDSAKETDVTESEGPGALRLTADELRQLRKLQVLLGLDPPQPGGKPDGASPNPNRALPSDAGPGRSTAKGPMGPSGTTTANGDRAGESKGQDAPRAREPGGPKGAAPERSLPQAASSGSSSATPSASGGAPAEGASGRPEAAKPAVNGPTPGEPKAAPDPAKTGQPRAGGDPGEKPGPSGSRSTTDDRKPDASGNASSSSGSINRAEPHERTGDPKEPNAQSKLSPPMTNFASGTAEPARSPAPGRVPESKDDKKPQPDGPPSPDAWQAPSPKAAPTNATTGETNEAAKAKTTNDDRGPRPASDKPVRRPAKEEDRNVAQKQAGSKEGDRNRSEPQPSKDRTPEEPKKKPEARPQPPEKPSTLPARPDSKDSPRPSTKQATPKKQDEPTLEKAARVTPAPPFSPPGLDGAPLDPNVREKLPHPHGSNGDSYEVKKPPSKSSLEKKPPSSNPPTKNSPGYALKKPQSKSSLMKKPPSSNPPTKNSPGYAGKKPQSKSSLMASHEPAEPGPGSAAGDARGGERAAAVGERGGPPARENSGTSGPPEEHDVQGTPHQASASGGLQTVGGPEVLPSRSGTNQAPSDHDAASPGAEGESSNAPRRFGDRSSSSARSTSANSRGGGTTPSGGGSQKPSGAGLPISDPVKDAPRKSSSVAEAHSHDSSETVAPDVGQVVLVLRKLEHLLRTNQVGPDLERESGMSRETMEQFVTRFNLLRKAAPGQGRDVEVQRGSERAFNDEPTSIALDWGPVGDLATRLPADVVDDQERDNVEGIRFVVPSELRSRFEAYKSSLSQSIPTRP